MGVPSLSLASLASAFPTTVADRVDRVYPAPGPSPMGLQGTRDGLWILDQGTGRASLVAFSNGSLRHEVQTMARQGSGITSDTFSLWITSTATRKLLQVDQETGLTQAEFDSPGSGTVRWDGAGAGDIPIGGQGVEWNRGEILVTSQPAAAIFAVKPRDGTVASEIPTPGVRPHGLGWDPDGSLWCVESNYRSFFKLNPANGQVIKQHMLPFDGPEENGKVIIPAGMTIWSRYIFFTVIGSSYIYRTPLVNRMS